MEFSHKNYFTTTNERLLANVLAAYLIENGGRLYNLTDKLDFVDLVNNHGIETAVDAYNKRLIYNDYYACLPNAKTPVYIVPSKSIDDNWDDFYKWACDRVNCGYELVWMSALKTEYFTRMLSKEDIRDIKEILRLDKIYNVKYLDENDEFELYFIDCNSEYLGGNMTCLKEKATGKIFLPDSYTYPISLAEAPMYSWTSSKLDENYKVESTEITLMNNDGKMEKYNRVTKERLEFLNQNPNLVNEDGEEIFDGITFIWQKNHTLCVKSYKDIAAGRKDISYIAIYKEVTDITPIKFYRQQNLNIEF